MSKVYCKNASIICPYGDGSECSFHEGKCEYQLIEAKITGMGY